MQVTRCTNAPAWDDAVNTLQGHPLQLWGWGEVKSAHGWQAARFLVTNESQEVVAGAQVLVKRLPWPFRSLLYIPRGPFGDAMTLGEATNSLMIALKAAYPGALQVVAEPDDVSMPGKGWKRSSNTILIPRTLILDLHRSAEELKAAMAKKTRQYINKSSREAIEITEVRGRGELERCLEIYRETAHRSHFALHEDQYYFDVAEKLGSCSRVFVANQQGTAIAFLWLATSGATAFELYGGMTDEGQRLRANYSLKWHAILECQKAGVSRYDLNGLLNDGISGFKQGFASHETTLAGTFVYAFSPISFVWETLLPAVRRVLRAIKKRRA